VEQRSCLEEEEEEEEEEDDDDDDANKWRVGGAIDTREKR